MKEDRRTDRDLDHTPFSSPVTRRQFLKRAGALGGGVLIYFSVGDPSAWAQEDFSRLLANVPADFNAFVRVGTDGRVTCFTGKVEMGQGVMTSLAQVLADELNVGYEFVDMVMGDTGVCPWDMGTFGSLTHRVFGPVLRAAAAEAKGVLKELASESLKVPLDRLEAKDGVISDRTNTASRVTYAELTRGRIIERRLEKKPPVEAPSEFTIVGKSYPRRDAFQKVTGQAKYSGDMRLPGMLYAAILRPPAHGATLKSVDTTDGEKVKGARIVRDGDLIAVLHEYPDEAERALSKVKAQFDVPESQLDDKTIFEHLVKVGPDGTVAAQGGDLKKGEELAADTFEETYLNSYVAHAAMETHTAVAKVEGNTATIWASTQTPFLTKERVAGALRFPSDNVRIITPFLGGGFGGKSSDNGQVVEAARLAKLTGKPVQVARSRAEEFFYTFFRPAAVVKIKSGVDKSGNIVLWDYDVYFAGENGCQQFYEVPHHRTVYRGDWMFPPSGAHPFDTGPWRAPANNTNTFARESQIDAMASKAGKDPLEFRLNNLKNERVLRVLKACADKFGWSPAKAPSNRGHGVACAIRSGAYVATMAEAEANKETGEVQVKRVVCAQDMGLVINPEGAKTQMEGCITMGLGYALTEEIHFKGGEIFDLNFDTYEIPRFSWLPKIETVLIDAPDLPPQGCGEPAIVCMGAVIANAVYDATGARLLQLPMTPERIKEAMKQA
jgi:isoquinoline 1-oxidoreductase